MLVSGRVLWPLCTVEMGVGWDMIPNASLGLMCWQLFTQKEETLESSLQTLKNRPTDQVFPVFFQESCL